MKYDKLFFSIAGRTPFTQLAFYTLCLMTKEQRVMTYKTVSYSLYLRLNQNPEGFQYGETQKGAAFCQGSNQSASSLVSCAAPILIISKYVKQRKPMSPP